MSARVLDLTAIRQAKRDAELRERFDIAQDDTLLPVGMIATGLIDRLRLRMAERRNRESRR